MRRRAEPRARDSRSWLGAAQRFRAALTSLEHATARARPEDTARPLIFADVADNPGGGGRGNTMWIIQAFHKAGVQDALVGVIHDPPLAAEAHRLGEGASLHRVLQS